MVDKTDSVDEFLSLLKKLDVSGNPYLSYAYYRIYASYYPAKGFVCLIVYNQQQKVTGLLPLTKKGLIHEIYGTRASNYLGYICREEDIDQVDREIRSYCRQMKNTFVIKYYDINTGSGLYRILCKEDQTIPVYLYDCPYVRIDSSFEELFLKKFHSSKRRAEISKFQRKLSLAGEVRFINITNRDTYADNAKVIPQIFKIHAERFFKVFIPHDLCLHDNPDYYGHLFEGMLKEEKAILSLILIDDTVVSFVAALTGERNVIDWMPGFDPAFSRYSLGTVHMKLFLEWLCGLPEYDLFDFSKGESFYKSRWADGKTENYLFVRAMNSRMSSLLLCRCIGFVSCFKSYLRKKGVLNIVKRIIPKAAGLLSRAKRRARKKERFSVEYYPVYAALKRFGYRMIADLPVMIRKKVLDDLYAGKDIAEVHYRKDKLMIGVQMNPKKGELL